MPAESPALEIRNVVRRFGSVTALDGLSLIVSRGEIVCLAGRSGCGKSTLLRVIAGIDQPDLGEVHIEGAMVSGDRRHVEPELRNIGFMFQDYALFPHLSVTDNIRFGLRKLNRAEVQDRSVEIIARLGIEHLSTRFPHMLSGGEQQRVALARALAPQPAILLMDEPFSNLDRELRDGIRAETLRLLRELGTTAIMVTHDPEEALSAGDTVVLMRDGRVEQSGSGAELYDKPVSIYAADFFGTFNRLHGISRAGVVDTPLGRFASPQHVDGRDVAVLIRPQDLRIKRSTDGANGTVVDCILVGEVEQIHVTVDGLPTPLTLRSTERHRLEPGEKVSVSVIHERTMVFEGPSNPPVIAA